MEFVWLLRLLLSTQSSEQRERAISSKIIGGGGGGLRRGRKSLQSAPESPVCLRALPKVTD